MFIDCAKLEKILKADYKTWGVKFGLTDNWTLDYSYVSNKKSGANYCNLGFYTEERKCVEVIGNIFDNPELLESEK